MWALSCKDEKERHLVFGLMLDGVLLLSRKQTFRTLYKEAYI
nr:MAG TPA: hypothetical protein [Caudoviricetes sp.]